MTKHLRFLFVTLLAWVCAVGGYAAVGDTYKLVTDVNDLKAGDIIVIGNVGSGYALGTTQNSNNRSATKVTIENGQLTATSETQELTLVGESNLWSFNTGAGYLYAAATKDKGQNYLKTKSAIDKSAQSTILIGNNGDATITFNISYKSKILKYNKTSNLFSCYSSGQENIQIYKKEETGTSKQTPVISFANSTEAPTYNFVNGKLSEGTFSMPSITSDIEEAYSESDVVYKSQNEDIVKVNDDKTLSFTGVYGTAKISVQMAAHGNYNASNTLEFTVNNNGIATEIDFEENGVNGNTYTVTKGETFTGHKAIVYDDSYKGKMKYSTTDASVANVDENTGDVTIGAIGTAVISAQFMGSDGYLNSNTVSYTINVVKPKDWAFYESFDNCDGKGGNDGEFKGTCSDGFKSDKDNLWTYSNAYAANKCVKVGGKKAGYVKTPAIDYTGLTKLSLKLASWSGDNSKVTIGIENGTLTYEGTTASTIELSPSDQAWDNIEMYVNSTAAFTVNFSSGANKRFFLDEVLVKTIPSVTFDESIAPTISAAKGVTVTLKRPMKVGKWNTFCVPFDISAEQVKSQFGENAEVAELYDSDAKSMTFTTSSGIAAGFPYIVKPSADAPEDGYVFNNVNVENNGSGQLGEDGGIIFKGIYGPTDITNNLPENTFAAGLQDNIVKKATLGNMKGFRAYFIIPNSMAATSFMISIDGTPTSIDAINGADVVVDAPVYNLQGQRVGNSLNGLRSGVYIQNGKKIVVK